MLKMQEGLQKMQLPIHTGTTGWKGNCCIRAPPKQIVLVVKLFGAGVTPALKWPSNCMKICHDY